MPLVSVLGCGTWFFLIEEQLYWQCRGLLRCHVTLPGALATTMEHWDAAAQHFEDALAMNTRMDARPWLAHTQYAYATMLLARNQPGDHDKATALLDSALVTARELGMRALEERLTARMGQTITPLPSAAPSSSTTCPSAKWRCYASSLLAGVTVTLPRRCTSA